ncbi:SWIRM domain-containing protein [Xylaria sp. FL0043]|nr:SWIRM domain-containing protein [Xylaria sp. FL0043]
MASMSTSTQLPEPTKPFDINNLMSPPEAPKIESFAHGSSSNNNKNNKNVVVNASNPANAAMSNVRQLPVQPLSPPISPATKHDDDTAMNVFVPAAKDPILFPVHDITNSPAQPPLFAREELADARHIVNRHISNRDTELFKNATPPEQDDYELVLYFKSQVMKKFAQNPGSWLKRERALLLADRKAQARHRQFRLHPILPAKVQPIRKEVQRAKPARAPKVTKPAVAKPAPAKPRPIRAGPGPATAAGAPAATTMAGTPAGLTKHTARAPSSTPDPSPRRGTTQTRADDDFNSVPDYCPPLSSLTSDTCLKTDWKTGVSDLTNDPHRHLLHAAEIVLASSLRLTAAVYLTSKRRIFVRRLECLRVGKEFRKTDAQQACKIDVNKASKLWVAFNDIGWLDKHWVVNYL